eukprot:UN11354
MICLRNNQVPTNPLILDCECGSSRGGHSMVYPEQANGKNVVITNLPNLKKNMMENVDIHPQNQCMFRQFSHFWSACVDNMFSTC